MTFKVVIPARYASTRLPAKPLADIGGRPMIQWVIDAARRSSAAEVWVATDDDRVAAAAAPLALLTRADHASGTDRIAEVAEQRGWSDDTIVVNVQGDEPQLPAALIDLVASLLARHPDAHIATLCTPIAQLREFMDPNAVKVVFDAAGRALYFSRAPIPWNRDAAPQGLNSQTQYEGAYRHLGIYAYRVSALKQLSALPPSGLEQLEKLEQLRASSSQSRRRLLRQASIPLKIWTVCARC
jgi:3-deoxy-manno-octulosonate cytidylyltransferase (CMP-KDO synthetase)